MEEKRIEEKEKKKEEEIVMEALVKAEMKFHDILKKYGLDGAYFSLEMKVTLLDAEFNPYREIILKDIVSDRGGDENYPIYI